MPTKCLCDKIPTKRKKRTKVKTFSKSSVSSQKNPNPISVILQGSSMNLPAPRTNEYNTILQQLDLIRRQQAASGSLIPNMARNDLLNRVQATNPFTFRSTNTQTEMLNPYEGEMEELVESSTTSNAYDNNSYDAKVPIDQDFIRQARINKFGQNLGRFTDKIGIVEDVETVKDLVAYDDEDLEDRLALSVRKDKNDSLLEKVKVMSEDMQARKIIERQVLEKNYERFLKKGKEEESYLTRRIKEPEPNLEEPIKKATSNIIDDVGNLFPKQKALKEKPKEKLTPEDKKEKQREYQREYRKKQKEKQNEGK
jgi:hypothetical protein